jgi:hypothetical protein
MEHRFPPALDEFAMSIHGRYLRGYVKKISSEKRVWKSSFKMGGTIILPDKREEK